MQDVRERLAGPDASGPASAGAPVAGAMDVAAMPLWDLFDQAVGRFADKPCLDFLGRRWTYRQLGRLVDRAAAGLQTLGVGVGTKVGLFLPNCPYFVICYFAVLKAGGTVVGYNPLDASREIAHQILDSETDLMVTLDLDAVLPKLQAILAQTRLKAIIVCKMADSLPFAKKLLFPVLKAREIAAVPDDGRHIWFDDLIANGGGLPPVLDPCNDIALLQYTGGTTGAPKGVALTHYNLQVSALQLAASHPDVQHGAERVVALLPLFHVFGLTWAMHFALCVGAEIILLPQFDLVQLLTTISRSRATILPGVPSLYQAINQHPEVARHDLSSLRLCLSGGAPLPLEVRQRFEQLSGCALVEGYGLSECPVVTCNPKGLRGKQGSVGLALPGTTIEVVSLDDHGTVLGPGETGEICVRGPQVMVGYWKRPRDTAAVLDNGRLRTGDIGFVDQDGACFLVSRVQDVIICSGCKVYPRVVEDAIHGHPDVVEVAVCGVPDGNGGVTVKAFVVLRAQANLDEAGLRAFLEDRLSPIEMPKPVAFCGPLPKSAIGKILKRALVAEPNPADPSGPPAALAPSTRRDGLS